MTRNTLIGFAAGVMVVVVLFFGLKSFANISNPTAGVTLPQVQALLPQPSTTAPQTEALTPAVGASSAYMRADAKMPRITRVALVTTDSAGAWSVTWSAALSAVPAVLAVPVNSSTQPVVCNIIATSTAGANGKCWMARQLPATIALLSALVSYDIFGVPPTVGSTVQILAIPPSQ